MKAFISAVVFCLILFASCSDDPVSSQRQETGPSEQMAAIMEEFEEAPAISLDTVYTGEDSTKMENTNLSLAVMMTGQYCEYGACHHSYKEVFLRGELLVSAEITSGKTLKVKKIDDNWVARKQSSPHIRSGGGEVIETWILFDSEGIEQDRFTEKYTVDFYSKS
ncbi:hypothetical protein GF382_02785 [Candidatus Falkowbacteria bacterium]|nr:hypothetical protein [Candidatus Falkowbacteria bacterium]